MAQPGPTTVTLTEDEIAAARDYVAKNGIEAARRAAQLGVVTLRKVLAGAEPVAAGTAELVRARLVRGGGRI